MAIRQEEERLIAFVLDDRKQVLQLLLREELHRPGAASRLGFGWCF